MERVRERLWGIEEVAAFLRVPESSVYKMTSSQARTPIPHLKIGGRLRFRRREIEEWLELWAVARTDRIKRARARGSRRRR